MTSLGYLTVCCFWVLFDLCFGCLCGTCAISVEEAAESASSRWAKAADMGGRGHTCCAKGLHRFSITPPGRVTWGKEGGERRGR